MKKYIFVGLSYYSYYRITVTGNFEWEFQARDTEKYNLIELRS